MKNTQQTKAQLLTQAEALRQRVIELETAHAEGWEAQAVLQVSETRYRLALGTRSLQRRCGGPGRFCRS